MVRASDLQSCIQEVAGSIRWPFGCQIPSLVPVVSHMRLSTVEFGSGKWPVISCSWEGNR